MYSNTLVRFCTVASAAVLLSHSANALVIQTFTDQGAWQAATGGTLIENFNNEATGNANNRDFGAFTVTRTGGLVSMAVRPGTDADNINGTNFLQFRSLSAAESMLLTFDNAISALGFDWRNDDRSADTLELIIEDQSFVFGPPVNTGFFGVNILDGMVTQVAAISDTPGGGGALLVGSFDNIRTASVAVPEPTTLGLFGIGLAALGLVRRRRRTT